MQREQPPQQGGGGEDGTPHSSVSTRLTWRNTGVPHTSRGGVDSRAYCSVNGTNASEPSATTAITALDSTWAYLSTQSRSCRSRNSARTLSSAKKTMPVTSSALKEPRRMSGRLSTTAATSAASAAYSQVLGGTRRR